MKKLAFFFAVISALTPFSKEANAASPPFIPIQGFIEEAGGAPVNGDLNIHFAIYDSAVGGTALWYETQNILVEEGFFAAYLGEVEAIDLGMFRDSTNLWLGVQVESDVEMERVYLGSTPFTGYAEFCGTVAGAVPPEVLPGEVVMGSQACPGSDKVVGVDVWGALVCATDEDTTYLAGGGLLLSGVTFIVDTALIQARVTGTCPAGSSISVINEGGSVVCESDDDTSYSAGAGLVLTGTTFGLEPSYLDGSAYDGRFVNVSGDTMTGPLNLPADGIAVGSDQIVAAGGGVGIGTASPGTRKLKVAGDAEMTGVIYGGMSYWSTGGVDPIDINTSYRTLMSVSFTTAKASNLLACYSLTCSFAGVRTWIGMHLDGGGQNESGWHENDLSIGAYSVNSCTTWDNVAAGSHAVEVKGNHNSATENCWRGKLDVLAYYLMP